MRSAAAGTVRATTSVTRSIACGRAGSDGLVRPFEQPTERVTELVGLDRLRQERVEALGQRLLARVPLGERGERDGGHRRGRRMLPHPAEPPVALVALHGQVGYADLRSV